MAAFALSFAAVPAVSADTLELSASANPYGPRFATLITTSFKLKELTFVGAVLIRGRVAQCPVNFAGGAAATNAKPVFQATQGPSEPPTLPPEDVPVPAIQMNNGAALPQGAWSLCGWLQPEGNTPTAAPSLTSGPTVFEVGGPTGTTTLDVPGVVGAKQRLHVTVDYQIADVPSVIPGSETSRLSFSISHPGAPGCTPLEARGCYEELRKDFSGSASGTETVNLGPLEPGSYQAVSDLVETMPVENYAGECCVGRFPPEMFGASAGSFLVLPTPRITRVGVSSRRTGPVLGFHVNAAATVTVAIARLVERPHKRGRLMCVSSPGGRRRLCGVPKRAQASRLSAGAGTNTVALRQVTRRGLPPGAYVVTTTAENAVGEVGAPKRIGLEVKK